MRYALLITLALAVYGCARNEAAPNNSEASAPQPTSAAPMKPPRHHAKLAPTQGNKAAGKIEFVSRGDQLQLVGTVTGLEPSAEHGFHIHENGDCSAPDGSSAGGHFNPTSKPHGNPDTASHHAGDARNIRADAQGKAKVDVTLTDVTLTDGSQTDVLGKAIVIHAKPDDYKSQPAGNSGARIACGVIQ
jgi:superoxide dismutase, Cu-Zn family